MLGKAKCKILKEIRQKIADENDIPYVTRECTYQGECSGTCPKCESELRYLERELEARQKLGKKVAVSALCAGIAMGSAGCATPFDTQLGGEAVKPAETEDLGGVAEEYPTPTPFVYVTDGEMPPEIEELEGDVACIDYLPANEEEDAKALERLEAYDVFASTYDEERLSEDALYYPEFTAEQDFVLRALTTCHWNCGMGAEPESIAIYDITDGNETLLGSWDASGRGSCGVANVNWDYYPDVEFKAGHTYRFVDSDTETWSGDDGSGGTAVIELRTDKENAVSGQIKSGAEIAVSEARN